MRNQTFTENPVTVAQLGSLTGMVQSGIITGNSLSDKKSRHHTLPLFPIGSSGKSILRLILDTPSSGCQKSWRRSILLSLLTKVVLRWRYCVGRWSNRTQKSRKPFERATSMSSTSSSGSDEEEPGDRRRIICQEALAGDHHRERYLTVHTETPKGHLKRWYL